MSRSVEVVDRKLPRQPVGPPLPPGAPASAAAVALAFAVSAAILAALSALLQIAVGHNEATEWTLFLAAFAVLLPASLVAVPRLTRDWSRPPRSERLLLLALLAALALTLALLGTRLLESPLEDAISSPALLLVALAACFGGALLLAGPLRASPTRLIHRLDPALAAWLPAGVLILAGVVFAASRLGPALPLLASLAIAAVLLAAQRRLPPAERFGPRASLALDIAVLLLVFLIVDDIAVYTSPSQLAPDPGLGGGTVPGWLAVHYDPFIGPANDVLHGRTVLVDTFSQYGVGNIYALAGFFKLAPLGYGTMGLLVAVGLALQYAVAFAILRLAGCARLIAAAAMAAAIISSVFHTIGTTTLFLSLGAQRWIFAYLLILCAVLAARNPARRRALRLTEAVLIGIAAIWSFETFVFTAATFLALAAYEASLAARGRRIREAGALLLRPALAVLIAQAVLGLGTLAASGELPDWGAYFALVGAYGAEALGSVLAPPWWPGVLVPALLFASALALVTVMRRRPDFEAENRPALLAIAGLTGLAVASFTYVVRVTWDDPALRTDLPALMLGALWLQLAWRPRAGLPRAVRTAVAAVAFWLVGLLIVKGWADFVHKSDRSPLVAALPGAAGSLRNDISQAWSNPPVEPRATEAQRLLNRYWPGQSKALVMLRPDLGVEALIRSRRANLLPVPDFLQAQVDYQTSAGQIRPALREIRPGTLLLTERFYLTPGARRDWIDSNSLALPIERLVMANLRRRFRFAVVRRAANDLVVLRLQARGPANR